MLFELTVEQFIIWASERQYKKGDEKWIQVDQGLKLAKKLMTFNTDDVILFYPKAVFSDDGLVQLYLFTKNNRLLIIDPDIDGAVVKFFDLGCVKPSCLKVKTFDKNVQLTLGFDCGETFTLDNVKDSNSHWQDDYYERILEIARLFT